MVNREKYDQEIDQLKEIALHYDIDDFKGISERLLQTKETFNIKILVVGHFNAGKSALLNALIGKYVLKEGQSPETAIAAEIKYGEKDEVYAYLNNGEKIPGSFEERYLPDRYDHVEYIFNSEGLRNIADFTLVDTPGFDSTIEEHTKALASYLGMGSGYLFVIDAEKGGIDRISLNFLNEISHYSDHIAVLINKCDKMTTKNVELIINAVEETLEMNGYDYPVYPISKDDSDVIEKLNNIILNYNAQLIYDKMMQSCVLSEARSMYSILRITDSKLYLDNYGLDEQIRKDEEVREHVAATFNVNKKVALQDVNSETQEVINKVEDALKAKSQQISHAVLRGSEKGAKAIILETVRPVILESMKNMVSEQIDCITGSLDFSDLEPEEDSNSMQDILDGLVNDLKQMIDQGVFESDENKTKGKSGNAASLYHIVTGIASMAKNLIVPWMEEIFIFLPDIFSFVSKMFSESPEDKTERVFIDEMIPQICNKLYPQIRKAAEENIYTVSEQFQECINEKLISIEQNIESAKMEKEKAETQFHEYQNMLKQDITELKNLIIEIEE